MVVPQLLQFLLASLHVVLCHTLQTFLLGLHHFADISWKHIRNGCMLFCHIEELSWVQSGFLTLVSLQVRERYRYCTFSLHYIQSVNTFLHCKNNNILMPICSHDINTKIVKSPIQWLKINKYLIKHQQDKKKSFSVKPYLI